MAGDEDKREAPTRQQVCDIQVTFPVKSDDDAISYKKKIGDIVADIQNARIVFSITNVPVRPNGLG